MEHYLVRWEWDTTDLFWHVSGASGLFDFRSLTECGTPAGPEGLAFAWFPTTISRPGAVHLGDDINQLTGLQKSAFESELGIRGGALPSGSLLEALMEALSLHCDPTGVAAWKPLIPSSQTRDIGFFKNYPARIRRRRIRPVTAPEWPNIRDVHRADYRRMREDSIAGRVGTDHHRRYLQTLLDKYPSATRGEFIPGDLPDEEPLPRGTTHTDNFNGGDQLTWTDVQETWINVSNLIEVDANGAARRAEHDVASDDMFAESKIVSDGQFNVGVPGPAIRFSASATTFYHSGHRDNTSAHFVIKVVTDTPTFLDDGGAGATMGLVARIEINGSDWEAFYDGTSVLTGTDTAISGNVRGGLATSGGLVDQQMDDFKVEDFGASLPFQPTFNRRTPTYLRM